MIVNAGKLVQDHFFDFLYSLCYLFDTLNEYHFQGDVFFGFPQHIRNQLLMVWTTFDSNRLNVKQLGLLMIRTLW